MSTTEPAVRNGVDVPRLLGGIEIVRERPDLAQFRFRATNRWVIGTHSRTKIETFFGAGREHAHIREYAYEADQPHALAGADQGPTPLEFLLHALGADLTAGIANVASARGVALRFVEASIEGSIDLRGVLGLSTDERTGCKQIRVDLRIAGDAAPEILRAIADRSRARSAVLDMLTRGVDVVVAVDATP